MIGATADPIEVSTPELIFGSHRIEGTPTGTPSDNEDNLAFSVAQGVRPPVEVMPLEQAGDAYARMLSGAPPLPHGAHHHPLTRQRRMI